MKKKEIFTYCTGFTCELKYSCLRNCSNNGFTDVESVMGPPKRNIKYIDECPYFLSKKKEKKCYPT